MRAIKLVSLLLFTGIILAGCGGGGGDTIKVAILAPLSGPVPTFGVMTRDGALLAIEEWNAKGGVLGKKIQAVVEDSQCTPDPAVNAANKVIDQDKVHYIIGEVCSKASIPVS
ncbi:MAG TPA: ABC transporter substrate-binding protein, partial [Candidatus Methylomirabilis sp.]|nr:ABC transporter substrate-binding protein [Candidatus Methylomirabilis sp.]